MADRTRFKHIKVDAASDDVVIYAGAHPAAQPSVGEASLTTGEAASAADGSSASSASAENRNAQASNPSDDYRETTIQDIRASRMPAMQKAIIAIAVLAIAAFVIWYVSFR